MLLVSMFFVMIRIQFEHVEHFAVHATTHAGHWAKLIFFVCPSVVCGRNNLNIFLYSFAFPHRSRSLTEFTCCFAGKSLKDTHHSTDCVTESPAIYSVLQISLTL